MYSLSGSTDEISLDVVEQFPVVTGLGMTPVKFRSAWHTDVRSLTDDENQEDVYRDVPEQCSDLVKSVKSLDPQLVQVQDSRRADGTVVLSGQDDGEVVETVRECGRVRRASPRVAPERSARQQRLPGTGFVPTALRAVSAGLDDEGIYYA